MRLHVLGSSGGSPTRENPASGYLVEAGATRIWLDCGTGTFMELARRTDPGKLTAVVVSHVHVDHCADLFGLYGYLAFGPSGDVPVRVFVPPGAHEHLSSFARATEEHVFNMVLDFVTVAGGDEAEIGDVRLTFADAVHPVPSIITRVAYDETVLVYSGDTGPTPALARLAAGADALLCEATLEGDRTDQTYPYHLTASEAGIAAVEAGVGELFVTHLGSTVAPGAARAAAAARFGGPVTYAAPGETFDIRRRV